MKKPGDWMWIVVVAILGVIFVPCFVARYWALNWPADSTWIVIWCAIVLAAVLALVVSAWFSCARAWRTILMVLGAAGLSAAICVLFGDKMGLDSQHKDAVLAVLFGIFAMIATAVTIWAAVGADQTLGAIQSTEVTVSENLQATAKTLGEISEAQDKLDQGIVNLEDATRRALKGLDQIFARALWLLSQAVDEIWYVNLLFSFGSAHTCNEELKSEYPAAAADLKLLDLIKKLDPTLSESGLNVTKFTDAVEAFRRILYNKVTSIRDVRVLILQPSLLSGALGRLKEKGGKSYEHLDVNLVEVEECVAARTIKGRWEERLLNSKEGLKVSCATSVPMQLLIAKLDKGDRTERKHGCLAFLVGTANIGTGVPIGFYTELEHVVDVYKEFAQGLMDSADDLGGPDDLSEAWAKPQEIARQPQKAAALQFPEAVIAISNPEVPKG
ncbi:MAG: hypothetical protein ABSC23_06945 [Bryobacteraceae bacterium]|jgi:hypothetical protein